MTRGRPRLVLVLVLALGLASARDAAAAEPVQRASPDPQAGDLVPVTEDDDPQDDFAAFPLVVRHDKHYLRAGLEVGSIVFVGFVDYLLNTSARGGEVRAGDERWALRYDWPDLRGKLIGTHYELDANRFSTNYVGHPFAGVCYYTAARSNHLSFGEAWIYATIGSLTWDFFGEIRERMSINDTIATPTGGAAIGEAMLQMSAFFDRGKKTVPNRVLSALFGPLKAVNYAFDGAEPLRTTHPDGLGFATEPYHRFELSIGSGFTVQDPARSGAQGGRRFERSTYADVHTGVDMQVANLPGYSGAGRHARLFDDGNIAGVSFDLTMSQGQMVHALFSTRVVPLGFYYRNASVDKNGRVTGDGAVLGMRIGFDYGAHDFDRDRARPRDLVSNVSPLGIAAEHTFEAGGLRLRTALDVFGSLAGVQAYALSDARIARVLPEEEVGLPSSTRNNAYYHGLGVTAAPAVEARLGAFELDASLRLDNYRSIDRLDEKADTNAAPIPMSDRRSLMRASLAWHASSLPLRLAIGAQRATRAGDVGPVHASRSESSLFGTLGLLF
jgi:hypothetical protein